MTAAIEPQQTGFRRVHRHQTGQGRQPWPERPQQPTAAQVCHWLREHLGPGGFRLLGWHKEVIARLYGRPRPLEAIVSIPRGNGKTTFAAALSVYELMGRGEREAQVLHLATTALQARLCYGQAVNMIERSPELASRAQMTWVLGYQRVVVPQLESFMQALPVRDERTLQGWTPAFAVVDEVGFNEEQTWTAMAQAMVKRRGSQVLGIGTPGWDQTGVMYQRRTMAQEQRLPTLWYREWAAPAGCRLDDREAWRQANPGMGQVKLESAMRHLLQTSSEYDFRTLQLGQWVGRAEGWMPPGVWQALERAEAPPEGAEVVLGFDGSAAYDSTALCWAREGTVGLVQAWERPGDQGWKVPREAVLDTIRWAFSHWRVRALYADPPGWRTELQQLAREFGDERVIEFPTYSPARMAPAVDRFQTAVLSGQLVHDHSAVLSRHVHNAIMHRAPRGPMLDRPSDQRKIDAAVAAVLAWEGMATLQPEPVYSERVVW